MATIDATLNIKLGELLDKQTELLERFDGGLTQVEVLKESSLIEIENKKNDVIDFLGSIIIPGINNIGTAGEYGFGNSVSKESLASEFGLVGLEGYTNPLTENYGTYIHVMSGSIVCYIARHYVKYTYDVSEPYFGLRVDVSHTQEEGYKLPRCFINAGVIVEGIFVDKYKGGRAGNIFVSHRNIDPVSTNTAHNPITLCTNNSKAPAARYDGMYDAVHSRGDNFALLSVFVATMLVDLADAHYQACYRNNNMEPCAWGDVAPYSPKGCNNNALRDVNDASVVYRSSGYSNCGLTGGVDDVVLAKTTHNGQMCGVCDINGLMWEVASGHITNTAGAHLILKESVDITKLTSATAYDTANYEAVSLPLALNNTQVCFGNGANQFFSGATDRTANAYKVDSLGFPLNDNGVSVGGSLRFGGDGFWRYQVNELSPVVFGHWGNALLSGPRARALVNVRGSSDDAVGGRAYLIPRYAG